MAICPFAEQRLLPENRTQPISVGQRLWIAHSIVGSAEGAYGYFLRSTNLESHFILKKDGALMQCIDTARTADANYRANGFAISVETEDNGDPNNDPWTDAQLYTLVRHGIWARQAHPEITKQRANAWNGSGYGYHSMFGAPSEWTPARGKTCPGTIRIKQFETFVLPGILKEASKPVPTEDKPARIIWFSHTAPITRKVTNHAYCVRSSGIAKHLNKSGLGILRAVNTPEDPSVYGREWQNNMAIFDGPCKNV